jgi:hypothetical protein
MPRIKRDGRTQRKDLRSLKTKEKEYWEEALRREGLSMDAGRSSKVSYVGNSSNLEAVCEKNAGHSGSILEGVLPIGTSEHSE